MITNTQRRWVPLFAGATMVCVLAAASSAAWSQAVCKSRGDLDANYCDENGDLVADLPKDPKKWKNPSTLV